MNFKTPGIYRITNTITKQIYIGSTAQTIEKRCKDHKYRLNKNTHKNPKLQNSWNKYGELNFVFEVLENVEDKTDLLKREQYFIDNTCCLDSQKGFNINIKAAHPNPRKPHTIKDKITGKYNGVEDGYLVTFPNGLVMYIPNLTEFEKEWGEEYDLNRGGLSSVARGEITNHKGFKVGRANPEYRVEPKQLKFETRPNTHVIFDSQGNRHEVNNLTAFCRQENEKYPGLKLTHTGLVQVSQGKYKQTKGYQCYKIENAPNRYKKVKYTQYSLTSPKGLNYVTSNLQEFAKEYNLNYKQLIKVAAPSCPNKSYKGWLCTNLTKLAKI